MNELDNVEFGNKFLPSVSWDVDESTNKLKLQISVFTTVTSHSDVVFNLGLHSFKGCRCKLSDVLNNLEEEGVLVLLGPVDEF